jgi:hypothetical protein
MPLIATQIGPFHIGTGLKTARAIALYGSGS